MIKYKLKPKEEMKVKRKEYTSGLDEDMRRYMLPPPEDLPLLRDHYPGEWFQRIDGCSVVQRWKDETGADHHKMLFYPALQMQEALNAMENDWRIRDDFKLLLWKLLQKYGSADYKAVPGDVTYADFPKYLNRINGKPRLKLKLRRADET